MEEQVAPTGLGLVSSGRSWVLGAHGVAVAEAAS